ncbi:MAG: hypothetical protein J6Z46_09435 [Lachnospiraceae bacterium]|nr:hypothetical protein [Lachnospiraceae bacterium]
MEFLYIIGAVALFLLGKGIYDRINLKKKIFKKLEAGFGRLGNEDDGSLSSVDSFFMYKCEREKDVFHIDDITSTDLDLVRFFVKLNTCKSQAGVEYLYYLLNTPCFDKDELDRRERLISFFSENKEQRLKVLYILYRFGKLRRFSLFSCIELLDGYKLPGNAKNFLCIFLIAVSIALFFFNTTFAVILLIISVIYNIVTYFMSKGELQGMLFGVQKVCLMLRASEELVKLDIPELSSVCEGLKTENAKLKALKHGAFAINSEVDGSIGAMITEYFNMIFHFDLIHFNIALKNAVNHVDSLKVIFEKTGYVDSLLAVTNLRDAYETWCVPVITGQRAELSFEDLYHPELSDPVPATLSASRSVLITGSNASGKSTFLKAVALNTLFAETIHTCFATSFRCSLFKLISSMALTDDIYSGESYYMTEIRALKRILEEDVSQIPGLYFIDEVLRGTNTVERIASSTAVLRALSFGNLLCFAATHDIELTTLLADRYENHHFDEGLDEEGNVCFDYVLKPGPSVNRNAIRLLKANGYPSEITDTAEEMAVNFNKTGKWSL